MRLRSLRDLASTAPAPPVPPTGPASPVPRAVRAALAAAFGLLWLLDLVMSLDTAGPLLPLAGLVPAGLALFGPRGRPDVRAGAAALWSLALSGLAFARDTEQDIPGLTELLALSVLLVSSARRIRDRLTALGACAGLALAVIMLGTRVSHGVSGMAPAMLLLTLVAAAATVLGAYLRSADTRQRHTLEQVRRNELLELANDLHDFIAHHITGIIVLAQAGRAVRESAPKDVTPIFNDIEQAGVESLDSIRQLIATLREGEGPASASLLSAQGIAHIPALVESFRRGGSDVRLEMDDAALTAHLIPEIVSTAHRVITEGLSNVRRHAPGATDVTVTVALGPGGLEATVRNGPPARGTQRKELRIPHTGQQGLGLVRLQERVRAVGGSLTGQPDATGGWTLTALLPVRDANPNARRMPV